MTAAEFAQNALSAFDAHPDRARISLVDLIDYKTETLWAEAPERWGTLEEAREANRLIAAGLKERGVTVVFRSPPGAIELSFQLRELPKSGIGWAVFQHPKRS